MELRDDVVLDLEGNAVPGASVLVVASNGADAVIFDKSGAPILNPLTTGPRGEYAFAAANGKYTLRVSVNGSVYATRGPYTLYDPADDVRSDAEGLAEPDGAFQVGYNQTTVGGALDSLRNDLNGVGTGGVTSATLAAQGGAAMIGTRATGNGTVVRTQAQKNAEIITPADRGAKGDAVSDDTASFAALELDITGQPIDLLGKTYLVTRQPTGNPYFNGAFKLSDGRILAAGREPSTANRGAEITLKSHSEDSRYTTHPGVTRAIVVLGDSISHGAFQKNLYMDGWVNILKRMMNGETGGKGYGFAPLLTLGSGGSLSNEVHDVVFSGSWVAAESTTGGGDILQGLSYTSTTVGSYIECTVPTFQSHVRIWYVEGPGAGTFSYSVNGGAATNVATAAASRNIAKSILVPMIDNGAGGFKIRLAVVSGSVTLCGVGYEMPPAAGTSVAGNVVQNFSQSGRRLKPATEGMIEAACQGSVLILALGYNDHADCANDPAYNAAFQQRIDWIIKYCHKYNTTLVVADFCWWATPANPARKGLKRAATEARGIYVPLPDYLTRDQMLKAEYSDSYYMVDTLIKWFDAAHPNANGAKWIAETVAKAMGLSCTSKEHALAMFDYPWPLQFEPTSIFKNEFTAVPYLSTIQRSGNTLAISVRAVTKNGAAIPVGAGYLLNKPTDQNSRQFTQFNTSAVIPYVPVNLTPAGLVSTAMMVGNANDIQIQSINPASASIAYGFNLPLDTRAYRA